MKSNEKTKEAMRLTRTQFIPFQLLLVSLLVFVYYGQ